MNETKKAVQDNLQETEQTSGSKDGTTSKDKVSISKAEYEKLLSDTKASKGRAEKLSSIERENAILKDRLESTNTRFDNLEREQDESRITAAQGDPDLQQRHKREQVARKRDRDADEKNAELDKREEQLKADRAEVEKDRGVVSIAYIAAKHGLDSAKLEAYGITDPEVLEKVANDLAAKPKTEEGESFEPDSGDTAGGAGGLAALEKANEDFNKGLISAEKLKEIASKVK